ncbi:ATP11 protein-domain-containing protein [Xylaria intraflava]|nr:ATP11 protein-domain-containing protein [Xylaria intraflava]
MVAARVPIALGRRLPRATLPRLIKAQQRRWAEVHNVRFLAIPPSRDVTERYREKLNQKAKAEGLRDVGELKAAYADRIEEVKKKNNIHVPGLDALLGEAGAEAAESQSIPSEKTRARTNPPARSTSQTPVQPLSEILDFSKAYGLSTEELSAVWRQRHASLEDSLCAVVPTPTYRAMERTARANRTFVLPLPREGQGTEIHYVEWTFDAESGTSTVLFTQLAEYKAQSAWARPHTTITHYTDYSESDGRQVGLSHEANQGVVLMAGSIVKGRGVSVDEARWLVMLLQRFYGEEGLGGDPAKRQLLEEWSRADETFSVNRLLEESKKLD